jgi:hypothetical protein
MSPEEELKFHYTVHTSLDVVEEKGTKIKKLHREHFPHKTHAKFLFAG